MSCTLIFTDTHAPFLHPDATPFLSAVKKAHRPDQVVHCGDVADFYCASRFTKDPRRASAGEEIERARRQLKPLYKLFPEALVCIGNHDKRLYDRAAESGVPLTAVKDVAEILGCPPDWQWGQEHFVDGVIYEHGEQYSGRDAHSKAAAANMQNTVIGHVHAHAGIHYVANRRHLIWGFNAGCLIDHKQYAFEYARKSHKPIIGCGIVRDRVPFFVPMNLRRNGRWSGGL